MIRKVQADLVAKVLITFDIPYSSSGLPSCSCGKLRGPSFFQEHRSLEGACSKF